MLEVATFFGAKQEYQLRGYSEQLCMNSFPSECFNDSEQRSFTEYLGEINGLGIIEILEYPYTSMEAYEAKRKVSSDRNIWISIDGFGSGINDMGVIELYNTRIVKLDRHLISDINKYSEKQENVKKLVLEFHSRGLLVIAEGLEQKAEFDYLVGLGVDLFQGYHLARPA